MKKTVLTSSILLGLMASSVIARTVDAKEKAQLDEVLVIGKVSNFGATKSEMPIAITVNGLLLLSMFLLTSKNVLRII